MLIDLFVMCRDSFFLKDVLFSFLQFFFFCEFPFFSWFVTLSLYCVSYTFTLSFIIILKIICSNKQNTSYQYLDKKTYVNDKYVMLISMTNNLKLNSIIKTLLLFPCMF